MNKFANNDIDIQKILQEIRDKSADGDYIYRGEPKQYEKISSTLYREYEEATEIEDFDIEVAQQEMLKRVREYTEFTNETDILTDLQHYGGKTNLIDFTTDYFIALFFACDGSYDADGRVILLNQAITAGQITSPTKNTNPRVISQKSIFFKSPKGYLTQNAVRIVSISKHLKQEILSYLQHRKISTATMYNDIFGYIQSQTRNKSAYTECYIGLSCSQKKDYKQAIEHYTKAIDKNPRFAEAYNNRGIDNGKLGLYEKAIENYDEAIRINPRFSEPYNNRGVAKRALGQHKEAIADYDKVIDINPQLAEAYSNRGNAKQALGQHKEAIEDFDKAIDINPKLAKTYNNRGNAKGGLGQYEEAIEDFDKAIDIDSRFAEAYNSRGTAKGALGQYEEAIADYGKAIGINPQYAKAHYGRGIAEIKIEKHKEARADFQRALELATAQENQRGAQAARRELGELPAP